MYMSLYAKDEIGLQKDSKLCEVEIYADSYKHSGNWYIQLHSWFNIKNILNFHDLFFGNKSKEFAEDFSTIQNWVQGYYECQDEELPKYDTYDFDKDYKQMIKDKGELTKIIKKRLVKLAEKYGLEYRED